MYVAPEHSRPRRRHGAAAAPDRRRRARHPGLEQLVLTVTDTQRRVRARSMNAAGFRSFGVEPRAIRVGDRYHGKIHMILFLTPTMTISRFSFPTTIHFGPGARKLVHAHLAEHGHPPPARRDRSRHRAAAAAAGVRRRPAGPRRRRVLGNLGQSGPEPGRQRRRGVQGAWRGRGRRPRRRRRARRRQGHRADGDAPGRHARIRVGPRARAADRPAAPAFHRAADDGRHRLRGRTLQRRLRRRHPRQEDHLLAASSWPRRCSPIRN